MKVRLDGSVSNAQISSDFGNGQTAEVVKADRDPLLVGKTTDRRSKVEQLRGHVRCGDRPDSRQNLAADSGSKATDNERTIRE